MNIYRYLDYRQILSLLVKERKKTDPSFNFSQLAAAIGVQKTYISKVINGSAQLSTDQLYLVAEYFGLDEKAHHYLTLLLEKERTGLARRRKALETRIGAIQLENRELGKHLKTPMLQPSLSDALTEYYLDPLNSILHAWISVPENRADLEPFRRNFGISRKDLDRLVGTLVKLGAIEWRKEEKAWRVVRDSIQLAQDSPLSVPRQALMRLMSTFHLMKIPLDERFSFSVSISADPKTKTLIHERFLKLLREIEPAVRAAKPEEVYQINFELFPWKLGI